MKLKNILLSCVIVFGSLSLSGCYTQLAMFYPDPEIDEEEQFQSYSVARVRPNLSLYANDGAGQSLGLAYQLMYNRFYGGYGNGYYNRYDYYNRYGYYNDYIPIHNIFVYNPKSRSWEIWIPGVQEKKQRTWTTDRSGNTTTNLTTTRSSNTSQSSNNSGYSNSSNVSSTRSSTGSSSSSSSSSSSNSGTRVTKRN